jgi:hypothetical protein
MNPDKWMQLGYNHARDGYPYLWRLERSSLTATQLRNYARGYLWSNPEGRAKEQKQYPGNIIPAKRDADFDDSIIGFFRLMAKCFTG